MKISVITAVYNNRDTVAQALDSALAQTHPDVELVVIDGGSTRGTLGKHLNKLACCVVRQAHHERNQSLAARPEPFDFAQDRLVEGLVQMVP